MTLQGDTPADIAVTRELLMPGDGSWPTVTIDSPRSFYDTGGASGKVPLKSEGTITFLPADPSKKIQMDVTGFGIFIASIASNSDQFKVYSGRTTDAGNLLFQATSSGCPANQINSRRRRSHRILQMYGSIRFLCRNRMGGHSVAVRRGPDDYRRGNSRKRL